MPLQSTSGTASYDAFGGGVAAVPKYIEEYFSTFLFTGNASTQTITNGIDLAGKGGLVWTKNRTNAYDNYLYDTARGVNKVLLSNNTIDQQSLANTLTAFNSTGFTLGNSDYGNITNGAAAVSWSWAKAPKFFDVVTWTGDGTGARTLSHNLGSVPGCIIVKRYEGDPQSWEVYHQSLGNTQGLHLDLTNAASTWSGYWNNTSPTATQFTVGANKNSGGSPTSRYVAYLFAHNAGGFGLTGTDNVISCGSYTTNGSGVATVDLGYEPQWVLTKATSGTFGTTDWVIADNMRGMPAPPQTDGVGGLFPNLSNAEDNNFNRSVHPTSTGFVANQYNSTPYIYIAIRRGPMKVPTSGTSVFLPVQYTSATTPPTVTTGFPVDMIIDTIKGPANENRQITDRLRGSTINLYRLLYTNATSAEQSSTSTNAGYDLASNTSTRDGFFGTVYGSGYNCITWNFRRAPSFFDEVCYTGTGVAGRTVAHNLTVAPELIIVKSRSLSGEQWPVYASPITVLKVLQLNTTIAATTYSSYWNNTAPTSSVFSVGDTGTVNQSGATFVAYLFATCAGVSKVGSYTGTATTLQIDCGFTGGARFVLIKRTDSTGDWYVWDSARGIVSGNDPYLLWNTTAAEVTNTDYVDTYSAGFEISSTAPAAINANGGTFIFLAIA